MQDAHMPHGTCRSSHAAASPTASRHRRFLPAGRASDRRAAPDNCRAARDAGRSVENEFRFNEVVLDRSDDSRAHRRPRNRVGESHAQWEHELPYLVEAVIVAPTAGDAAMRYAQAVQAALSRLQSDAEIPLLHYDVAQPTEPFSCAG